MGCSKWGALVGFGNTVPYVAEDWNLGTLWLPKGVSMEECGLLFFEPWLKHFTGAFCLYHNASPLLTWKYRDLSAVAIVSNCVLWCNLTLAISSVMCALFCFLNVSIQLKFFLMLWASCPSTLSSVMWRSSFNAYENVLSHKMVPQTRMQKCKGFTVLYRSHCAVSLIRLSFKCKLLLPMFWF